MVSRLLNDIKDNQMAILIGEIGALLHDIGKCHPDFVKKNSIEKIGSFKHTNVGSFLEAELVQQIKDEKFKIEISGKKTDIYSLITEHHNQNTKNELVKLIKSCDSLDSADDKGIVRRKQPVSNTMIATPFGFEEERIDLDCMDKRKDALLQSLDNLFVEYLKKNMSLECFREGILNVLQEYFPHALGETRIPANDVTLWHHSYSTASLFKSCLASLVFNGIPSNIRQIKWRLLGICWNGVAFIQKAKKVGDIKSRTSIIDKLKAGIRNKMEVEYPVGNAVYEDINGLYFTFPDIDKSNNLAKEICQEILPLVQSNTENELWPFFSLSNANRSLTTISKEIKEREGYLKTSKMSPVIFVRDKSEPTPLSDSPSLPELKEDEEICPACRFRTKTEDEEVCKTCFSRRQGRLDEWLKKRDKETIWTYESTDENGRIALLTLRFDLSRWFDGRWFKTVFSQTVRDWLNSPKGNKLTIDVLKDKGIFCTPDTKCIIDSCEVVCDSNKSKEIRAAILETFFENKVSITKNNLDVHLQNISQRIVEKISATNLASFLFTQNSTTARLYRMWKETEKFFYLLDEQIKEKIYNPPPQRISFKLSSPCNNLKKNGTYYLSVEGLNPFQISCLALSGDELLVIDSARMFRFKDGDRRFQGAEAIKEALLKNAISEIKEEESGKTISEEQHSVISGSFKEEPFLPFITVIKSPVFFQVLVPASDSIRILRVITSLYNQRYAKVQGKLPFHVGLVVAKRKVPLYALLEAGQKILNCPDFSKLQQMYPYWDTSETTNDPFFGFYPSDEKFNLTDLKLLNKGENYYLTPGRFDFDFMEGTIDRYRLFYKDGTRIGVNYGWITPRPYFVYEIENIVSLWEILTTNLSNRQINNIEHALTSKLTAWRNERDSDKKDVFRQFAIVVLKNSFGSKKWESLPPKHQCLLKDSIDSGLLMDTIQLMKHLLKKGGEDND